MFLYNFIQLITFVRHTLEIRLFQYLSNYNQQTFCVIYFYPHTGKWQNNQQFDGGHSAVELEVEYI